MQSSSIRLEGDPQSKPFRNERILDSWTLSSAARPPTRRLRYEANHEESPAQFVFAVPLGADLASLLHSDDHYTGEDQEVIIGGDILVGDIL